MDLNAGSAEAGCAERRDAPSAELGLDVVLRELTFE